MAQYTKIELLTRMTEWVDEFWSSKDSDPKLNELWLLYSSDVIARVNDDILVDTDRIRHMNVSPLMKIGLNTIDYLCIPFSQFAGMTTLATIACYGNPGILNMYLAAFKHESATTLGYPLPQVGNVDWVNSVTNGVWHTEEFLHTMWDKQKLPDGSNLVDRMGPGDFLFADEAATIKD